MVLHYCSRVWRWVTSPLRVGRRLAGTGARLYGPLLSELPNLCSFREHCFQDASPQVLRSVC